MRKMVAAPGERAGDSRGRHAGGVLLLRLVGRVHQFVRDVGWDARIAEALKVRAGRARQRVLNGVDGVTETGAAAGPAARALRTDRAGLRARGALTRLL